MKKNLAMQYLIFQSELRISEICEKLNVSRFIVHKWLSGKSNPRRDNLNKLARINNVDLIWENNNEVSFSSKLKKNEKDYNYDNETIINDIISNQSELIKILQDKNRRLQINLNKFRMSKTIINDNDYYFISNINSNDILEINVPNDGLLGYSQSEFISLSKLWPHSPLFSEEDQKHLDELEKTRFEFAKNLNIIHFDISDHILYNSHNGNKKWGYFIKYYNLETDRINTYIKFLSNTS